MFPLKTALSGLMWFLDKLYGFLSHRVILIILYPLLIAGMVFYFHDSIFEALKKWSLFTKAEGVAVILAIILSQLNYDKSVDSILEHRHKVKNTANNNPNDEYYLRIALFFDQSFALINFVLFAFSIYVISKPVRHVLCIQAILFCFATNNFLQKQLALKLRSEVIRHDAVIRAMDMHHWLFSENGPGVFGYLLVILLLWGFACWHTSLLAQDQIPHYAELLEAITAGVAGYQISLSTAVYFLFHDFRTARALEFAGFADVCKKDEQLITYIRKKMGRPWFIFVVLAAFVGSLYIVLARVPV